MSNIEGIDPAMALLKERAHSNELDYQFVMDCLKGYKSPRTKLTGLLKSGALIRVRKGLYLMGPRFKNSPYCLELLANMIYGLIPEHVTAVTSVTAKLGKDFKTPVGHFLYAHCHPKSLYLYLSRF